MAALHVLIQGFGVCCQKSRIPEPKPPRGGKEIQAKKTFFLSAKGRPGVDVMITLFCDFYQFSAKKLAFF
jgi:hypothetical protein